MSEAASLPRLVLASTSPRRADLLREAGIEFDVVKIDVEEAHDASLSPEALTVENARRKAVAGSYVRAGELVLGADTLVYVDGDPLAKPADMQEALSMVRRLSGRTHEVATGVVLARDGLVVEAFHVITHVTFKTLSDETIRDYHTKVNPLDKAGGYGIQAHTDMLLERMDGSFTNVVGLPVERLLEVLRGLAPASRL